jgi:hypothetical protein
VLNRDVDLHDSTYTAGRLPARTGDTPVSDRIEKLRAKQGQGQSLANADVTAAPAPKKERPLVQGSCGHFTKRGKPGQPCGPCRNKAEVEAAIARRQEMARPSVPKFKRLDAKAGRLPDRARFVLEFEESAQRWKGTLEIPGLVPFSDSSSGVFKLLTKLDQQYRKAVSPATTSTATDSSSH